MGPALGGDGVDGDAEGEEEEEEDEDEEDDGPTETVYQAATRGSFAALAQYWKGLCLLASKLQLCPKVGPGASSNLPGGCSNLQIV